MNRKITIFLLAVLVLSLLLLLATALQAAPGVTGLLVFLVVLLPALAVFWLLQMRHAPRQIEQRVPVRVRDMDTLLAELNAANRPHVARVLAELDLPENEFTR